MQRLPFNQATMRMSEKFAAMIEVLIRTGKPHEEDYYFLSKYPKDETLIVDVGSNIGNSCISFSNILPGVRILGFEPNLILRDYLDRAQAHCPSFSYAMIGLGETAGCMRLHIPVVDGILIAGEASIDPDHFTRAEVTARLRGYSREKRFDVTCVDCRIERMDDQEQLFTLAHSYSKRIVKIDVEGTELSVLKGGVGFLRRFRPTLVIEEGHREGIATFLSGMGYSRYVYAPESGQLIEAEMQTRLNSIFVWRSSP
jgi:FkbM family methyltransferase